jgi:hypothetical protein
MPAALSVQEYESLAKQCDEQARCARTLLEAEDLKRRAARWRRLAASRNITGETGAFSGPRTLSQEPKI